ncbi:hypothetical protein JCM11641_001685 [Rhodosporidiobolus odoratus]
MAWFSPTYLISRLPTPPSLPLVGLPSGLQQRLVTFLLRRALGSFIRVDSWEDGDRVEADVWNGRVKIRDVQLDTQSINALLASSPSPSPDNPPSAVPVELVSGHVTSLTALIGYPSLTGGGADAKLDIEVNGLELVLRLTGEDKTAGPPADQPSSPTHSEKGGSDSTRLRHASLSSSTSSFRSTSSSSTMTESTSSHPLSPEPTLSLAVAHEFISTTLSPAEDAELRASLHLRNSSFLDLPGAFSGARPTEGATPAPASALEPEAAEDQVEEVEAGLLANMVERILARLGVRVKGVKVRLLWDGPGEEARELEMVVEDVSYRGAIEGQEGAKSLSVTSPMVYLSSPTPLAVSPKSAPHPASPPPAPSHTSASPASPSQRSDSSSSSSSSSSDSGDDSSFLAMSQGVFDLRTSTPSLGGATSTSASGMFKSARSFAPVQEEKEEDPFTNPEEEEDEGVFATPRGSPVPWENKEESLPGHASEPELGQRGKHLILSLGAEPLVFSLSPHTADGITRPTTARSELVLSAHLASGWTAAITATQLAVLLDLAKRFSPSPSASDTSTPMPASPPSTKPSNSLRVDFRLPSLSLILAYPPPSDSTTLNAAFSSEQPNAAIKTPHIHLSLSDVALSNSSAGLELSLGAAAASETSSTVDGASITLPLFVSDPKLSRSRRADGAVYAADWLKAAAGEEVDCGERWNGDGRFLNAATEDRRRVSEKEAEPPAVHVQKTEGKGMEVQLAPFHLFADFAVLERLEPLLAVFSTPPRPTYPRSGAPQSAAPSALPTPRPSSPNILADFSPISASSSPPSTTLSLSCPRFRLSLRCRAPVKHRNLLADPFAIRSGRLLIDLASLSLRTSSSSTSTNPRQLTAEAEEVSLRFAHRHEGTAKLFTKVAPLVSRKEDSQAVLPCLSFFSLATSSTEAGRAYPEVALTVPLLHVEVDKRALDGLQLFADDVGQFFAERGGGVGVGAGFEGKGSEVDEVEVKASRPALWASGELEASTATVRGGNEGEGGWTTLRVAVDVTDAIVDLYLDRLASFADEDEPSSPLPDATTRHLQLGASDLSVGVELRTGGQEHFRADVEIMDVKLEDVSGATTMLTRTVPRNLAATTAPLPVVSVSFASSTDPDTGTKASGIQTMLSNLTAEIEPGHTGSGLRWLGELAAYAKAPEGAFENAVPTDITTIRLSLASLSLHAFAPSLPCQAVVSIFSASLSTVLARASPRTTLSLEVSGLRAWAIESEADLLEPSGRTAENEAAYWKSLGFVELVDAEMLSGAVSSGGSGAGEPELEATVTNAKVEVALCADSISCLSKFAEDISRLPILQQKHSSSNASPGSGHRFASRKKSSDLLASVDPAAFERAPSVHDLPEILDDDVPTNLDYLADALNQTSVRPKNRRGSASAKDGRQGVLISEVDGEAIRMFKPKGLHVIDDWLTRPKVSKKDESTIPKTRFRLVNADVAIHLHEGYNWSSTRKAIEEEAKAVRRRLEKIRQLLASGQKADARAETKSPVLMFGSLHLGLPAGASELPDKELLAAINEELDGVEGRDSDAVSTTSSWQTFLSGPLAADATAPSRAPNQAVVGKARKKVTKSRAFAIEINLRGLNASYDIFSPTSPPSSLYSSMLLPSAKSHLASKLSVGVSSLDIIDNIKTSTWGKFLTELRVGDGGVVRPTGAPVARLELSTVKPLGGVKEAREELLLKLKISPLRLYIDQDALDFLKAFGAFKLSPTPTTAADPLPLPKPEPFFQRVEVLPVKIKLDYKPKRVDYGALKSGKTAELMNFFHFDGSEMTLRHLVVTGVTGSTTLSSLVQDIWTPDVKAHQLADVISGIAPVRSVVNVGSGMANLVLLPLEQYYKDGRVVRGLQKGAQAFAKQTTLEAINVGAKLATGTQVILEQAEHVLGGDFRSTLAAETVPTLPAADSLPGATLEEGSSDEDRKAVRSRYAEQPSGLQQGVESAYKSFGDNVMEAAQTILAVPMEVYERSSNEGPVRAVVRAVPIAVLKPMIGASGAVSKALLGLRNSLDPSAQERELEDKYKRATGRER